MLAKHSFYYLFARGIPGLINFAALAVYTRLLAPDEYGQYAIVIAVAGFFNMLLFEWLHLGLLRYLPGAGVNKPAFLSTLLTGYLSFALIGTAIGALFYLVNDGLVNQELIIPGLVMLLFTGLFNINLQLKTAQLLPLQYGKLSAGKAVLSLMIGALLVWYGFGAKGILFALSLAMGLTLLLWASSEWQHLDFSLFDKQLMRKLMIYGFPLAANLAMAEVISSSDRLFLVWMHDTARAGLYAAGYDLASHVLGVLLMIINLASYPLAVRALEQQGRQAASDQLRQNLTLIMGVAFPAALGLAVLAPGITTFLLGEQFQQAAEILLPWVALAALMAGLKSYYFDLSFQLAQNTLGQLKVLIIAALLNVLLNFLLIPDYAVMGAIVATLIAYACGLFLSIIIGRKSFTLPFPVRDCLKISAASLAMGLAIWPFRSLSGVLSLIGTIVLGILVYLMMMGLLNVAGARKLIREQLGPGMGHE